MKLNLKNILITLKDIGDYVFPIKKLTSKFGSINSKKDLKSFIQERSAHVTQTTLYGYIKTRIGTRYAMMFEDEIFLKSINQIRLLMRQWWAFRVALPIRSLFPFALGR